MPRRYDAALKKANYATLAASMADASPGGGSDEDDEVRPRCHHPASDCDDTRDPYAASDPKGTPSRGGAVDGSEACAGSCTAMKLK